MVCIAVGLVMLAHSSALSQQLIEGSETTR